ncbi:GAF domain-containing protein [Sphingomonas sp. NFR15]|nr:GAF domain-containing protein [Sphingomonas sp. NFR15]
MPVAGRGWRIDEAARAEALAAYDLAALRGAAALRRITDFAAALCGTPVALVSLVEEHVQCFVSRTGTDLTETPRDVSFCQFAMTGDDVMVVPDARADPKFADNALVTGEPFIRFYAGAPLVSDAGVPLGALCVIDTKPHDGLTPLQHQGLLVLAEDVMARFRAVEMARR